MKCIRCGHDSKYKDRRELTCPRCHKWFAFEPREGAVMTDAAFQAAIDAVSAKGSVRWGVEHLYYEVCRRRQKRGVPLAGCGVSIAVFVAVTLVGWAQTRSPIVVLPGVLTAVVTAWLGRLVLPRVFKRPVTPTVAVPLPKFDEMWARWQKVHLPPKGVIVRQEPKPRARPAEPDLGDYSFDRAVVCDRARTVDLLLANNFHFENNCAVLSIDGYPRGPFETVRTMLRKNPRLQVFALHDATPAGCRLAQKLASDPAWFKDQVPVTDVGLRPSHARLFRGLWLRGQGGPVVVGDGVKAEEAAWLSQHALELAAIRPEQVLKRLFRAINRKADGDTSERGGGDADGTGTRAGVVTDPDSFQADAVDSDGGPDSFG